MYTLVNLAGCVDEGKIVFVNKMFENEINESKGSYERTRDTVHNDHGKKKQHPSILLPESINSACNKEIRSLNLTNLNS